MERRSASVDTNSRRQFLASGVALLSVPVAGCGGHPPVVIDMQETTEDRILDEVSEGGAEKDAVEHIRAEYLFTLTDLSDSERDVVEEAIDGGYYQDSDAFRSVVDRFRKHKGLDESDTDGSWLVEYQRTEYVADIEWEPGQ